MPASAVDTVALHCCHGKLLADGFGSLRLQDVSFIKEEKSERVLINSYEGDIETRGMMQSLSSTFSRQLSQFPKHTNHALELCVKHQVRNSMTNM